MAEGLYLTVKRNKVDLVIGRKFVNDAQGQVDSERVEAREGFVEVYSVAIEQSSQLSTSGTTELQNHADTLIKRARIPHPTS